MNTDEREKVLNGPSVEIYPEQRLTHSILEASFAVHNTLGVGFLEKVYGSALSLELRAKGFACEREVPYQVKYRDVIIGDYVADLIVERRVLVELKSVPFLEKAHEAQTINYLRVSGLRVGLLLNFGRSKLQYKRFVC